MYLDFYKLREEPFNLTPDPRFLHMSPPYRVALEAVVQSIVRRRGFVVVSGPIGTGKTTVLHAAMQMVSRLDTNRIRVASAFVLNPLLSRDEFLETLMIEFQISRPSASKPARLAALQELFLEMQKKGGTSVLIVDEAHLLSMDLLEEIRLLSNSDTCREKLLQIVLCGQPELMPLLQRGELRALWQRITHRCSLRPLTLEETQGYITERLRSAGLTGRVPFRDEAVELVHIHSKGVPRLINQICDGALMTGFSTQRKDIHRDIVQEVMTQLQLAIEDVDTLSKIATSMKLTLGGLNRRMAELE